MAESRPFSTTTGRNPPGLPAADSCSCHSRSRRTYRSPGRWREGQGRGWRCQAVRSAAERAGLSFPAQSDAVFLDSTCDCTFKPHSFMISGSTWQMENVLNPSSHSSGVSGTACGSACFAMMQAMFSNISNQKMPRTNWNSLRQGSS